MTSMENNGFVHGVDMNEKRVKAFERLKKTRDFKTYQETEEELLQSMTTKLVKSTEPKEELMADMLEAQGGNSFMTRMRVLLNKEYKND